MLIDVFLNLFYVSETILFRSFLSYFIRPSKVLHKLWDMKRDMMQACYFSLPKCTIFVLSQKTL